MAVLTINEAWMSAKPGKTAAFWLRVGRYIVDNLVDTEDDTAVNAAIAAVDVEIEAELQQAKALRAQAASLNAQATSLERQAARGE